MKEEKSREAQINKVGLNLLEPECEEIQGANEATRKKVVNP